MEGAARIFAGEFNDSTLYVSPSENLGSPAVVTPGGAWCNLVVLSGVLTEVSGSERTLHCRLADPTGAFDLEVGSSGMAENFRKIPIPSFIIVTGRALMNRRKENPEPFVRVESVQIVDRFVRDLWITRTADLSLIRIKNLAVALRTETDDQKIRMLIRHYRTVPSQLLDLVAMVESAVSGIRPLPSPSGGQEPDPRETIISIIKDNQGQRGIAIEDVIAQARLRGISAERAKETIDALIREDEIYQPQKGAVRLL